MKPNKTSWPAPTSRERDALDAVLSWVIDGMGNTLGELTEEDEEIRNEVGIEDGWLRRVKETTSD